jgi:hypothetical protein
MRLHAVFRRFFTFVGGLAFLLFYVPFFAGLCERLRLADFLWIAALAVSLVFAGDASTRTAP